MEPDGQGYLGFAAGATLLRILQLSDGGLTSDNAPLQPPSAPVPGWEPSHTHVEEYLDSYFRHYHMQYPILHEATFRAQWNFVIATPPESQWTLLANVVLGLGAFCASAPMEHVDHFLQRAAARLNVDQLESGSLTLVQAFTLLSNLAQKRNKPNSGSVYLGIAVRMAIGLGLHRELPSWNVSPFEREVRRRVWWIVFCFDAGASITFGRPILLPSADADVQAVHNVIDRTFTVLSDTPPARSPVPTVYTSLIHQSAFHAVGNDCYTRAISTPPPTPAETLELDGRLDRWYSALPATIRNFGANEGWLGFASHKIFWRYSNLRIILHRRAFLERALKKLPLCVEGDAGHSPPAQQSELLSSTLCLYNARTTISSIAHFLQNSTTNRLEQWYALHFLFHASFVPMIALKSDPTSGQCAAWEEELGWARETLLSLRGEALAKRCLRIFDQLNPPAAILHDLESIVGPSQANLWPFSGNEAVEQWLPMADLASLNSFWLTATE